MVRKFYDYVADVYRATTEESRGSSVESRTLVHSQIRIALWKSKTSYRNTSLAVQTDSNGYEANLMPEHEVSVGDILVVSWRSYKVDDVIAHHRAYWTLDNWQVILSATENEGD